MKRIDVPLIRSFGPCYDPTEKVSEDWSGTVLDVLALEDVSVDDKLWLVLREELLSAKLLRLFAVSCARDVQHLITDEEIIKAIDVAERYAHGLATDEEFRAARVALWDVDRAVAWDVVWAVAWDVAWSAARAAAWAAAGSAQVNKLREMILAMPEEVK